MTVKQERRIVRIDLEGHETCVTSLAVLLAGAILNGDVDDQLTLGRQLVTHPDAKRYIHSVTGKLVAVMIE